MYATTEQDCNDWVSLINWRLVRTESACLIVDVSFLCCLVTYFELFVHIQTKHASSKQTMDHRC